MAHAHAHVIIWLEQTLWPHFIDNFIYFLTQERLSSEVDHVCGFRNERSSRYTISEQVVVACLEGSRGAAHFRRSTWGLRDVRARGLNRRSMLGCLMSRKLRDNPVKSIRVWILYFNMLFLLSWTVVRLVWGLLFRIRILLGVFDYFFKLNPSRASETFLKYWFHFKFLEKTGQLTREAHLGGLFFQTLFCKTWIKTDIIRKRALKLFDVFDFSNAIFLVRIPTFLVFRLVPSDLP